MYRSAIFWDNEEEKKIARDFLDKINDEVFNGKIATTLEFMSGFWEAEKYHHNYIPNNPQNSYCQRIAVPKFRKFLKNYEFIKEEGEQ